MDYYLDRVTEDKKEVLYRLLQYSLFEESETDGNEMNEEGLYKYDYFDTYFIDKKRDAFFIRNQDDDKLLGFVMINDYVQKIKIGHK